MILELFEQLDPEQQRKQLAAAAGCLDQEKDAEGERRLSVPGGAVRVAGAADAPTPASLANVDVTLAEQSGASKQSNEGTSPLNQLSPLQLGDFLTAL